MKLPSTKSIFIINDEDETMTQWQQASKKKPFLIIDCTPWQLHLGNFLVAYMRNKGWHKPLFFYPPGQPLDKVWIRGQMKGIWEKIHLPEDRPGYWEILMFIITQSGILGAVSLCYKLYSDKSNNLVSVKSQNRTGLHNTIVFQTTLKCASKFPWSTANDSNHSAM